MGWKNVKQHFKINHIVSVSDGKILIGSRYISELASIDMSTGLITENKTFLGDMRREYPQVFGASCSDILSLIAAPDVFEKSLPVYTPHEGEILEKYCEKYGWPNVTHDGILMYDNTFFKDKTSAIKRGVEETEAYISRVSNYIVDLEEKLTKAKSEHEKAHHEFVKFKDCEVLSD